MLHPRKKLVLVTRVKFWLETGGVYLRSANLMLYLGQNLDLTVIFIGHGDERDDQALAKFSDIFTIVWWGKNKTLSDAEYCEQFQLLCLAKKFDACLIIRLDCVMFRPFVPMGIPTFLDIDDLASEQDEGKTSAGMGPIWNITFDEELAVFKGFDYLLVIHNEHKKKLSHYFNADRIIVAGHAIKFDRAPIAETVKNIGFIGSYWEANIDAMYWFMYEVWPEYENTSLHMHIFGEVAKGLHKFPYTNVTVHSYVEDLQQIYRTCDIFVNPVRYGSGLKIKAVEALAKGLPLVASNEGTRGLSHLQGEAFLIANTKQEYIDNINYLIANREARLALGEAGYRYANLYFTPNSSYGHLLHAINSHKSSLKKKICIAEY